MTSRRELLIALGTSVLAAPLASFGQKPSKTWRLGVLWGESRSSRVGNRFDIFLKRFGELGYAEGQNFVIDWRSADGKYERLEGLAAELVKLKVDVIVVIGIRSARAARQSTATIPIVAVSVGDPVGAGLAASLSRPGGNFTGSSNLTGDLEGKRLELLLSAVPKVSRIAQFVNPDNATGMARTASLRAAAQKLGREFLAVEVRAAHELEGAFSRMVKERVGALMVPNETSISEHSPRIVQLALQYKLPSIFGAASGAEAGGLISYGPDPTENYRRAAVLVDRIFKGAKPGDLPIEQPTKIDLVINLKTAKAIGLTISQELLLRADRVIE